MGGRLQGRRPLENVILLGGGRTGASSATPGLAGELKIKTAQITLESRGQASAKSLKKAKNTTLSLRKTFGGRLLVSCRDTRKKNCRRIRIAIPPSFMGGQNSDEYDYTYSKAGG